MPKWSKDYEIKKTGWKTGHVTYKRLALIHLVRLIHILDSLADNLMTSIFKLRFNNLAQFEKTGFVTSWSKECHVMLEMNFPKLFKWGISFISLWNPLFGSFGVIKKDLCIFFLAFQPMP